MRRFISLPTSLIVLAVSAPASLAGAGSGSSGYSGGGGGGGYSGGGGSGGGIGTWDPIAIVGLVVVVIIFLIVSAIATAIGTARYKARRTARREQVASAALEAAEDDPDFAPDAVTTVAGGLYVACQEAWDARDRDKLATMVGDDLLVEWKRRLDDFDRKDWHNRVKVIGAPTVEYLGLVNRAGEAEDRVVVRICAKQDDFVEGPNGKRIMKQGETNTTASIEEWWTLARRDGRWIVVSIEQEAEGKHNLESAIVARPDTDEERLHDEATVEVAQDDAAPAGVKTAEIADLDFDGDARAAAMDLALADARFAPDVLEVAVRRAVAGWAEAIDGEDAPLLGVAAPDVADRLLHPNGSDGTRLVVRGPRVQHMRITKLDAATDPARMSVEVDVAGRRYIENRDTAAVVAGSKDSETTFTERWTLAIDGPPENPWRIVGTGR